MKKIAVSALYMLPALAIATQYDFSLQKARIDKVKSIIEKERIILEKIRDYNGSEPLSIDTLINQGLPQGYKNEFEITEYTSESGYKGIILRRLDKDMQNKQFQKLYEQQQRGKYNYLKISGTESNITLGISEHGMSTGFQKSKGVNCEGRLGEGNSTFECIGFCLEGTLGFCTDSDNNRTRLIAADNNWTKIKSQEVRGERTSSSATEGSGEVGSNYVTAGATLSSLCEWYKSKINQFYLYGAVDINESLKLEKVPEDDNVTTRYAKTKKIVYEDSISGYFFSDALTKIPNDTQTVKNGDVAIILNTSNCASPTSGKYVYNGGSWVFLP